MQLHLTPGDKYTIGDMVDGKPWAVVLEKRTADIHINVMGVPSEAAWNHILTVIQHHS